jgi:hypothetical protein
MSSGPKFTSVQHVLDFIGKEFDGGPCDAITALQTAVFHQQNQNGGKVLLSKKIGLELFSRALRTTDKEGGTKYTAVSEMMMFAFPVLCERLLASALYMMKDPRNDFLFESSAVGARQHWGDITKLAILDKSADSHKIEFEYDAIRYIAYFYRKEETGFCMRMCQSSEDGARNQD